MQIPVIAKKANGMSFEPQSAGIVITRAKNETADHRVEREPGLG